MQKLINDFRVNERWKEIEEGDWTTFFQGLENNLEVINDKMDYNQEQLKQYERQEVQNHTHITQKEKDNNRLQREIEKMIYDIDNLNEELNEQVKIQFELETVCKERDGYRQDLDKLMDDTSTLRPKHEKLESQYRLAIGENE